MDHGLSFGQSGNNITLINYLHSVIMFPENVKASDTPLYLAFAKDRRLLREVWGNADDTKTVTIVALDLEKSTRDPGGLETSPNLDSQANPRVKVTSVYSIELFVRRAERAVGPVTINVPPFKARVPPTAAPEAALAPAAAPTPGTPPWLLDTATPITQNDNRRKSWSSSTIANNPNLIPVNPTRDRLSRKRKMGDRDEDDESSGVCNGSLKRSFSSDIVHEVLQKQQGLREEKPVGREKGKASQKQPGGPF
ncbi:hypothetical protein VM1G_08559 [Cytospora mali]|uniref:Uncharacterized protein n=1 Tax=Cytospora mali TaxID=578113 RepID=A0A194W8U4_CYTMA|nr:hypothetical protein VM1G_08559 [Valsa mali]